MRSTSRFLGAQFDVVYICRRSSTLIMNLSHVAYSAVNVDKGAHSAAQYIGNDHRTVQ